MPKIVDSAQRREFIARMAAEVISESGLEGLSIRAVAKRAGATRGFIEHYYASKSELIEAATTLMTQRYKARVAQKTKGKRGLAALRSRFKRALPRSSVLRNEWRLLLRYWGSPHKEMNTIQRNRLTAIRELLETYLADAIKAGELPRTDIAETAQRMLYITSGLCALGATDPRTFTPRYLLKELEHMFAKLRRGEL